MAKPVRMSDAEKGRALAEWRSTYPEVWGFDVEWDEELGVPIPTTRRDGTARCPSTMRRSGEGEPCRNGAGAGTSHPGVGACFRHDTRRERAAGAWTMAHKIAQALDISPWEALLLTVRRAAGWAAYYEMKMAEVEDDEELRPGGAAYHWVEAAERVNEKLARWSKAAVDAGVAQILVQRAQMEGTAIVQVLNAALAAASLDEESEMRIRAALRNALLERDVAEVAASTSPGEVAGDVVE